MELYRNDYFYLTLDDINVSIHPIASGYEVRDFVEISNLFPRLKLTQFGTLTRALNLEIPGPCLIGLYRKVIELTVSSDGLEATLQINLLEEEYAVNKAQITRNIYEALQEKKIKSGIQHQNILSPLLTKPNVIAKGQPPIPGVAAKIKYYEFSKRQPEIRTDGSLNHYELNLIDNVDEGEWLGEKVMATPGEPGFNIYGDILQPLAGRDQPLLYDRKSIVAEVDENGIETIRAKKKGAVRMIQGKIAVDDHLTIPSDVNYKTGNINFDGFVTVIGTVQDGFSVVATNDITIASDMGVGSVKLIHSKEGSVLIKGGVNGKQCAQVKAGQNVYLKYANECEVLANEEIHIGFYALDSQLKAQRIHVNREQGRVIGGLAEADFQIVTGTVGNASERATQLKVKGFVRKNVQDERDAALVYYKELLAKSNKTKRQIAVFENHLGELDDRGMNTFQALKASYEYILEDIMRLHSKVEKLQAILKTRGEGEVQIAKSAHPRSQLEIKHIKKQLNGNWQGTIYIKDNALNHEAN